MATDDDLWRRWIDGDVPAGTELVQRYFVRVYRFFSSKAARGAEELTQRTFHACVEGRERYRGDAPFRAYLFGIARNQLLRFIEGRGADIGGADPASVSIHDLGLSPSRVVAGRESDAAVLEALSRIPLDLQIVVELYYWEDLKTAEIGAALGIPPGTVMSRLSRARDALKKQLRTIRPGRDDADIAADTRALREALLPPPSRQ